MRNETIQIAPMQWALLPDIADVPPISEGDHACLDEIREVLIRHKAIGRFGVHLVHKHFDVDAARVGRNSVLAYCAVWSGETYQHNGGRGVYFDDPDGHLLEVMTRPYEGVG